jgi:signal transduction histidine kinase
MKPLPSQDVTVLDLPYFGVQVEDTALGSEVARILEQNHALPGVVVMNRGAIAGMVARNQFFQRLGRPFGVEIYLPRPISAFLESLTTRTISLVGETTIQNAVILCLARPPEHVYDPFVVEPRYGPPRLVDLLALILKQTELLTAAQIEAHAQRAAAVSASNAKSDFLANMSHELRTPLTAIIGYSEILIEDVQTRQLGESVRRLEGIARAGRHLLEMINGLLDLAKIEARKMDLFIATYSLTDLIAEVTQIARPLMAKNSNEFRVVNADPTLNEMRSDEAKLRQCLINLLGNAAKFTTAGTVTLTVRKETAPDGPEGKKCAVWAAFDITDTGIGMTPDQLSRVFESFSQADPTISRRFGGTGLGLTITRQYCDMIGGLLTVKSTPGSGTTFTLKVPTRLPEPV